MEDKINASIEDNSLSTEYTLRPIVYTSWLFGVGVARPRKYSKALTIFIRIIHLILCSINVAYGANIFIYDSTMYSIDSYVFKFLYSMNRVMCWVSAYYYVCHGIWQYDKWPELMDKIKELDQKIRKEIFMNNRPRVLIIVEALAILITFVCCPLSLIAHALYYYFVYPEILFTTDLLFYYILAQSLINSFVFDVIVYMLYYRFQKINKLISQLNELFDAQTIALKIRRIRELHNGTCDLIDMVNDVYGLPLLLCWGSSFTMIVTTQFRIYAAIMENNYRFIMVHNFWWILYTMQFSLICWICTLAREESERTGIIIYSFLLNRNNLDGDYVRNEVNDFSTQLQQHRVVFTACNFFEINNELFSGFVGIIVTYLVIFIQFYKPKSVPDANVMKSVAFLPKWCNDSMAQYNDSISN
ncbi:gustatory and pheromone receptor 32a-like [Solenopsis invicta]|uniref:gustatory and pheromone receptor 32a-like n=1 Tax=Solenopsis invicta TaxID=13686 RepID=UPI00193D23BB|nr:gustatory and pheromone receptor 32a-like [Solenopsis invicta]